MSSVAVPALSRRNTLATTLGFVRRHVLTAYSILFFAYLLLPIGVVVLFSFNHPTGKFNYTWQGFTWDNWRYWNGVPGIQSAIVLSLEIALLASVVATALGTLIALALVRYGFRRQSAGRRGSVRVAGAGPQGRAAGPLQPLPHRRPLIDYCDAAEGSHSSDIVAHPRGEPDIL